MLPQKNLKFENSLNGCEIKILLVKSIFRIPNM